MCIEIHPREKIVNAARLKLAEALDEIRFYTDLTTAEFISVVSGEMGRVLGTLAKYAIRQERHGNTDTPGGQA